MVFVLFFLSITAMAMDSQKGKNIAVAFSMGDVISYNMCPETIIKNTVIHLPELLKRRTDIIPWNVGVVQRKALEIARTTNGISNVLQKLNTALPQEGYEPFNQEELKAILALAVSPCVNDKNLEFLKLFINEEIPVIGATRQDIDEYLMYQEKMKEQRVNISSYFTAGIVTTPTLKAEQLICDQPFCLWNNNHHLLVAKHSYPHEDYLRAFKFLAPDKQVLFFYANKEVQSFKTDYCNAFPFESPRNVLNVVKEYEQGRKIGEKGNEFLSLYNR